MSTSLPNYTGGRWQPAAADSLQDVVNPATLELLAQVPLSAQADVAAVVDAASAAFPEWRRTPPEERIQYLFRLKQLLEEHIDEIARLVTMENGKTYSLIVAQNPGTVLFKINSF